jgi:hypothetical protein
MFELWVIDVEKQLDLMGHVIHIEENKYEYPNYCKNKEIE